MESPSPRTNDGAAPGLDMASNNFSYLGHSSLTLIALELFFAKQPKLSHWKPLPFWALESHRPIDVLTAHILSSLVLKLTRMQLWEV